MDYWHQLYHENMSLVTVYQKKLAFLKDLHKLLYKHDVKIVDWPYYDCECGPHIRPNLAYFEHWKYKIKVEQAMWWGIDFDEPLPVAPPPPPPEKIIVEVIKLKNVKPIYKQCLKDIIAKAQRDKGKTSWTTVYIMREYARKCLQMLNAEKDAGSSVDGEPSAAEQGVEHD